MKTILVPTDFSNNAFKALIYAAHLAKAIEAKILLLNAYQAPTASSNVMINFTDILEEDSKKDLDKTINKLKAVEELSGVEIEGVSVYGFLTEAIAKVEAKNDIDLVIMGTAGASNLSNRLFGSNTTDAIKNTKLPLLVIPRDTEYKEWKNITFASNIQKDKNDCPFKPLTNLVKLIDTHLHIVTVVENESEIDKDDIKNRIDNKLQGILYDVNVIENDSVAEGILDFIDDYDTDLLVLIRKNYGFIEGLLHSSVTKKLALHSAKPMLLYKACD